MPIQSICGIGEFGNCIQLWIAGAASVQLCPTAASQYICHLTAGAGWLITPERVER